MMMSGVALVGLLDAAGSAAAAANYTMSECVHGRDLSSHVKHGDGGALTVTGYQSFHISAEGNLTFGVYNTKYEYVRTLLHSLRGTGTVHSLTEIGCNTGLMSLVAQREGFAPVYAFDSMDQNIEVLREVVEARQLQHAVHPMVQSFDGEPVPPADVVICGAVVHWLYYVSAPRFLGDLHAIVEHIAKAVGAYLVMEWIRPEELDHKVAALLPTVNNATSDMQKLLYARHAGVSSANYTQAHFEELLQHHIGSIESKFNERGIIYLIRRRKTGVTRPPAWPQPGHDPAPHAVAHKLAKQSPAARLLSESTARALLLRKRPRPPVSRGWASWLSWPTLWPAVADGVAAGR